SKLYQCKKTNSTAYSSEASKSQRQGENIKDSQKKLTYKGTPIRLSADFSAETLQARREWNDIFKNLKDKNMQPRILYPAKISFKYDGEIKTFPDKQKLR
uniref:L1 transposable element dsRBD-like domain-containing protein n=1 Tax=Equus caballus TaxID=9796 RepID=A0A9L0TEI0_HORSE